MLRLQSNYICSSQPTNQFLLSSLPTFDSLQQKAKRSNRKKTNDDHALRQNAKIAFTAWLRHKREELPFRCLENSQINYLLQLHFDNAYPEVDFSKAGLEIPLDRTEIDDHLNADVDPIIFFGALKLARNGQTYTSLQWEFWELGQKIQGFSIPKFLDGFGEVENQGPPQTPATPKPRPNSPKAPMTPEDVRFEQESRVNEALLSFFSKSPDTSKQHPSSVSTTAVLLPFNIYVICDCTGEKYNSSRIDY